MKTSILTALAILGVWSFGNQPAWGQTAPEFSMIQIETNREVLLRLTAPNNFHYQIDVSTNLSSWEPLVTSPVSTGSYEYLDSGAPFIPNRFYRAKRLEDPGIIAGDHMTTSTGDLVVHPIDHATFVMRWSGVVIYNDPVGGSTPFQNLPAPDVILVSDIHGDHLSSSTISSVLGGDTVIVAPTSVYNTLSSTLRSRTVVVANGGMSQVFGMTIEGVPMYNITPGRLTNHPEGRGNGYLLTLGGKRIYISGDTEDIPEMRALRNIDMAFVCMNLPWTMDINQASSAVREFRPAVVYPYHYSSSDVQRFKQLVGTDLGIEVRLRDWY